jgi:hypothetical protein
VRRHGSEDPPWRAPVLFPTSAEFDMDKEYNISTYLLYLCFYWIKPDDLNASYNWSEKSACAACFFKFTEYLFDIYF